MKKRTRYIIAAVASVVIVVCVGNARYREITWISLNSGRLQVERKILGFRFYKSAPQDTTISEALSDRADGNAWSNVGECTLGLVIVEKNNLCYPHILFWVGAIDRCFNNHNLTALTAKMALEELGKTKNPCALRSHLERFRYSLVDDFDTSWSDDTINSEVTRIWEKTT